MRLNDDAQWKINIVPDELTALDQWICWRYRWNSKKDRWEKPPVDPRTGKSFDWRDSSRWLSYQFAKAAAQEHGYGIAFVCTPDDPFSFPDLDDVRDSETGEIKPWAREIVERIDSYTEISPSGTGLRIAMRGKLPRVTKAGTKPKELFVSSGYVTFTGNTLPGYETIHERQQELEVFYETHIRRDMLVSASPAPLPNPIDLTDPELVEVSHNVLTKARHTGKWRVFRKLHDDGDTAKYAHNHNAADMALCGYLASWCGGNPAVMDYIFRQSALMRPKWDEKRGDTTYGQWTIETAIQNCPTFYSEDFVPDYDEEVAKALQKNFDYLYENAWEGRRGPSRRAAYATILFHARKWGKIVEGCVEVAFSKRQLAPESGLSNKTFGAAVKWLRETDHIELVAEASGRRASTYRINEPKFDTGVPHKEEYPPTCVIYEELLCQTGRERNPNPHQWKHLKQPLGKRRLQVFESILTHPGISLDELSDLTSVRKNSLKSRYVSGLVDDGFVKMVKGKLYPAEEYQLAFERHQRAAGSVERYEKHRHDNEEQVKKFRNFTPKKKRPEATKSPDDVPIGSPSEVHSEPSETIVEAQTGQESKVVELPLVASDSEVFTPTIESAEMVRNVPEKAEGGIYDHGMICSCCMCEEDAPEYASVTHLDEYEREKKKNK